MIYHFWSKNHAYDATYQDNIQEKDQEHFSMLGFEKPCRNKQIKKLVPIKLRLMKIYIP